MVMLKAIPSRIIWRRRLMVRQPYSEAVKSDGVGAVSSSTLRFMSPTRGSDKVVKNIEGMFSHS